MLEREGEDLTRDVDRLVCVGKGGRDLNRQVDQIGVCRKERERPN